MDSATRCGLYVPVTTIGTVPILERDLWTTRPRISKVHHSGLRSHLIENNREAIASLCRLHGVRSLEAFGSILRDDFDVGRSDVDVLVEFEAQAADSFSNFLDLKESQEALFQRSVKNGVHAPPQVTRQGVDAVTDPKGVDDVTDPISEIGTTAAWETSCAAGEGTNATTRRAL